MSRKMLLATVLAILAALPAFAAEKAKFSISGGGLLAAVSQGYDFDYSYDYMAEKASFTESVPDIGSTFGFDVGIGIYPVSQVEVYASYCTSSGTAVGAGYSIRIPHFAYLNAHMTDEAAKENEYKASIFNFGIAYHPAVSGRINPYFGVGASSVRITIDMLDEIEHSYITMFSWGSLTWVDAINIRKVKLDQVSATKWGFHAKIGFNVKFGRNVYVFIEGRYLAAKIDLEHLDMGDLELEEELINVNLGGLHGIAGIKFIF